jgi:hypothetical protein
MKNFKSIFEALIDDKTDNEDKKQNFLHKSLSKHYHFNATIKNSFAGRYTNVPSNNKHVKALHRYTQGDTGNHPLWEKHKNNIGIDKRTESHINNIQDALHYHKTPFKFHVYSSTIHDPRDLKDSNNVVHHPAFMSTTLNKDFAKTWERKHNHILKINVPKESPGAYVEHFSAVPGQNEFILPHGHNLKYKKTESYNNTHYHYMDLLPKENN